MTQYNNKIDLNKRIDVQIQAFEMNNSQRNISVNLNVFFLRSENCFVLLLVWMLFIALNDNNNNN